MRIQIAVAGGRLSDGVGRDGRLHERALDGAAYRHSHVRPHVHALVLIHVHVQVTRDIL